MLDQLQDHQSVSREGSLLHDKSAVSSAGKSFRLLDGTTVTATRISCFDGTKQGSITQHYSRQDVATSLVKI